MDAPATPLGVLEAARELLSDKQRWTTDCLAACAGEGDAFDRAVGIHDGNATCWCAIGALCKVTGTYTITDDISPRCLADHEAGRPAMMLLIEAAKEIEADDEVHEMIANFYIDTFGNVAEVTARNDKMGYEVALKMYDRAIELARAEQNG